MGSRANLIVVSETGYELFSTHWEANRLDGELFWGPEQAIGFIRRQRDVAEGAHWWSDASANGGVLVDLTRSLLLWWGGDDTSYDIPTRRLFLRLMAPQWPGWEIRWAHEGVVELVDYVGVPRDVVLSTEQTQIQPVSLAPPEKRDWVCTVLSARRSDGSVAFFPLDGFLEDYVWDCDALAKAITETQGLGRLDVGEWTTGFPSSGLHVDLATKTLTVWTSDGRPELERRLRAANPSWRIEWTHDRYESQLEAAGPALVFPRIDAAAIVDEIHVRLISNDNAFTDYIVDFDAPTDAVLPLSFIEKELIWIDALRGVLLGGE